MRLAYRVSLTSYIDVGKAGSLVTRDEHTAITTYSPSGIVLMSHI